MQRTGDEVRAEPGCVVAGQLPQHVAHGAGAVEPTQHALREAGRTRGVGEVLTGGPSEVLRDGSGGRNERVPVEAFWQRSSARDDGDIADRGRRAKRLAPVRPVGPDGRCVAVTEDVAELVGLEVHVHRNGADPGEHGGGIREHRLHGVLAHHRHSGLVSTHQCGEDRSSLLEGGTQLGPSECAGAVTECELCRRCRGQTQESGFVSLVVRRVEWKHGCLPSSEGPSAEG